MISRFQTARWSDTRKKIHALEAGQSLSFPQAEYFNAKSSADRLTEAYGGEREYKCSLKTGAPVVTRTK